MGNKTYDIFKWIAQILLPALGTLYFALAGIWGLPKADEVVGTIVALDAFLGILLGISSKLYNQSDARYDGAIVIEDREEGSKLYSLNLNGIPEDLDSKKEASFKIIPPK